jgi:hypothetical protein
VDDQLSGQAEILVSEAMDMTGSWYAASWCVQFNSPSAE